MLLYSFVACLYLFRPTSIGLANNQSVIASGQFGRLRRR
ncbi:putative transmembrane protein [Bacteroides fragilis str. Korea 419]|nr:putative transmembrane protein [Bacteroides fragilis str. Korea 419]